MANMREIKLRIKSIQKTKQITKAMKLISAAKLKKARQQLDQTLPFFDKVRSTMADIVMHSGEVESMYFDKRPDKESRRKGYIIITGDIGLAGGYNHNIIKLAESLIKEDENHELFMVGYIGRNYFIKGKFNVREEFEYSAQNPTIYRARDIMEYMLNLFVTGELDEVHVVYTLMESSVKVEPKVTRLLPLELDGLLEDLNISDRSSVRVDESLSYEPSERAVFDALVPKYVKGIMYGALVESFTSEQNARMTAMDNATANADEMLEKFNLYYNRARQATITQEISEIVGGAQALGSK